MHTPFAGQRPGQVRNAALAPAIGRPRGTAHAMIEARRQQDQPGSLRHHASARSLRRQEDAGEVDVDRPPPLLLAQFQRRLVGGDAGIGVGHVHAAPGLVHRPERGFDLGAHGDVAANGDPVRRRIRHRAEVQDAHPRAPRMERIRHRAADALAAAGHQHPRAGWRQGGGCHGLIDLDAHCRGYSSRKGWYSGSTSTSSVASRRTTPQ